jgi:type III secretory pathway component EscT
MAPVQAIVVTLALALCRSAPLLIAVPFVGWTGRLLLFGLGAALLGPLLLPYGLSAAGETLPSLPLWPILLHELGVGLFLLFGALLPWAILRTAGSVLDALRADDKGPLARLSGLVALCLFFGGGGASLVVAALAQSYAVAPLPALLGPAHLTLSPRLIITMGAQLFTLSLKLALPLVGAWLCALLGLSLGYRFLAGARPLSALLPQPGAAPLQTLPVVVELVVLVTGFVALVATWQAQLRTLPYLAL